MLIFSHVDLQIGKYPILRDINMQIPGGEFIVLTGPSGAGKSSLISLLLGLRTATQGRITIDGIDISRLRPALLQFYRRKIGVVFQDYKLLPQKTVSENIAFALKSCGVGHEEALHTMNEVIKKVKLSGKENRYPHELSGGEQQRVSIARAIVHSPRLFLADEPTGNLDRRNADEVIDILRQINEDGSTVFLTTHDEKIVKKLRARTIVINNGEITEELDKSFAVC